MFDPGHGCQMLISLDSCHRGSSLTVHGLLPTANFASSCSRYHDSAIYNTDIIKSNQCKATVVRCRDASWLVILFSVRFLKKIDSVWNEFGAVRFEKLGLVRIL